MMRRVEVVNHFAAPLGAPGGTRHVELFSRLTTWSARIHAADTSYVSGQRVSADGLLETVRVRPRSRGEFARALSWIWFSVATALRLLRSPRPDVVYASTPHLFAGLAGAWVARVRRVPFVLEVRDLWPQVLVEMGHASERSPLVQVLRRIEEHLYRQARCIVVLAPGVRRRLMERGLPGALVEVIPNGADPADPDLRRERAAVRREFGLEGFVVLYAGAHGPANGLGAVLDAAAALQDEAPDVLFVLLGDGVEKSRLQAAAEARRLSNVRFLDPVPKEQVPRILAAADVGLHVLADVPLFRDGVSPNKIYDYMGSGLPVLTNVPGDVAELVYASGSGLAVDPDRVVDGVRELRGMERDQLHRLGAAAQDFLVANSSRASAARALEKVLESTVAQRRR